MRTCRRRGERSRNGGGGKITRWQAKPIKARFLADVRVSLQPYADTQSLLASLPQAFDLDGAVGAQLDAVGARIGRNRYVPIPLPDTTFALDIAGRGLDEGYWRTPYDGADAISLLPDSLYRPLLYAKVLANAWDGLAPSAVAIVTTYLTDPATIVFINDDTRAIRAAPGDAIFSLDDPNAGLDQGRFLQPGEYPAVPERVPISYGVSGAPTLVIEKTIMTRILRGVALACALASAAALGACNASTADLSALASAAATTAPTLPPSAVVSDVLAQAGVTPAGQAQVNAKIAQVQKAAVALCRIKPLASGILNIGIALSPSLSSVASSGVAQQVSGAATIACNALARAPTYAALGDRRSDLVRGVARVTGDTPISIDEVATAEGLTRSYTTRLLRLSYLAPDITARLIAGERPPELNAARLMQDTRLPLDWAEQRAALAMA